LVDIHPVAAHKTLKTEQSGEWVSIGLIERSSSFFPDITSSEKVLARSIDLGLFEQASFTTYERVDYVESVDDWANYITRPRTEGFAGNDAALAAGLERLAAGDESLRVHTEYQVATYVSLKAGS
jgi:hypothetical protein